MNTKTETKTNPERTETIIEEWIPELLVAIDPGINSLGWALFHLGESPKYVVSGNVEEKTRKLPIAARIHDTITDLEKTLPPMVFCANRDDYHNTLLLIEQPENWGSFKTMASTHSGSMQKLTLLVGALIQFGWSTIGRTELVRVSTWKGQLPKSVVQDRLFKTYGQRFRSHDEADAVGIGDWYVRTKTRCQ